MYDNVQSSLHVFAHFNLRVVLWYYYSHFVSEETKASRVKRLISDIQS